MQILKWLRSDQTLLNLKHPTFDKFIHSFFTLYHHQVKAGKKGIYGPEVHQK